MKGLPLTKTRMWLFLGITVALFLSLVFARASMQTKEISANWSKYRMDPFYMFAAPMFKPDDDPRSRLEFATDNFKDVVKEMINNIFAVLLKPLFAIFKLLTDALITNLNSLFNAKGMMDIMWNKWVRMADIFQRRFNGTFHNFRMTFTKIFNSMERSYAIATASLMAGLSAIHSMTSFLDLVIKVIIAILVILVAMVILFFFVLFPSIPLILLVIGIISATAVGGAVGGMSDAFCFTADTKIATTNGYVRIDSLRLGQQLSPTNKVVGLMQFVSDTYDLYYIDGIVVSGSHIIYNDGVPIHVKDHLQAYPLPKTKEPLYCLITTEHTIPIVGISGLHIFADWEEIDTEEELQNWYQTVYEKLNGQSSVNEATDDMLHSESAVAAGTHVFTDVDTVPIEYIVPGQYVMASNGTRTRVIGIIKLASTTITASSYDGAVSAGAWVETDGMWDHPKCTGEAKETLWYSLFTEHGTFVIHTSSGQLALRDFSDIGAKRLDETYTSVLKNLHMRAFFQNDD